MVESACRAQIINGSSREAADAGARFSQKSCKINTKPQTIYKNEAHLREKQSVLSVRKTSPVLIDWLQLFLTAIICSLPCGFHWQLLFEGKPPWTPNTFRFFSILSWRLLVYSTNLSCSCRGSVCVCVCVCVCVISVIIYHRSAPSQHLVCFCAGETRPMIHCCVPKLTNRDSSAEQRKVQTHLLMTVLVVLPQCPHFVFFLCLSYRDVYTHIDICTYT